MDANTLLLGLVVLTALAFDFTNGFHDTANAMATSIATGALPPKAAVTLSAVLNFAGAFLSLQVAATIATGIVDSGAVTVTVVFAGLVGGLAWNLLTWYYGIPSSSSHALIGGVVGATLIAAGAGAVKGSGIVANVLVPALLAPLFAILVATLGTYLVYRITAGVPGRLRTRGFRLGQIGSASLVSLAHGTNDAQKTMGVITLALVANETIGAEDGTPFWVVFACALAIGLGTYVGGWRVIRTMGKGLIEIESPQGFSAEGSSAAVIFAASHFGFPLSTTHVCSGSIMGAGVGKRLAEVRWGLAGRMVTAWLVTLPAAGLVGALAWKGTDLIGGAAGVAVVFAAAVVFGAGLYRASRRAPVDHTNVNHEWTGTVVPTREPVK
ncbi:PiT family inorganic phosphate transporter [Thermocatellispora tengchongensis]|uniref:Phosphate transporter n=1 Tax=Thermocatellispora tengchongensis TaxID=1073253 RepID=A0A840NXL8_9ACTN|nr:inorganic phosphate transporter [Thermocatellispora tengchongensis]MBB5133604.1 PiT family inorganic phosphate transporter [Thermocatellispora tengchongensis]